MSTDQPVTAETKTSLLADLESRQDELLRMLAELEARTEQALAALGVKVAADPSISVPAPAGSEPKRAPAPEAAKPRRAAA
jgi:hypothetical protein